MKDRQTISATSAATSGGIAAEMLSSSRVHGDG
jgi:hypothetical protein